MAIITVPKDLIQNKDLVAVPRDTYQDFLAWQKAIKSVRTFKPTKTELKVLARARKNLTQGKYQTLQELAHELGVNR